MKNIEPWIIPELKARIDNLFGASIDNVYGCDVPALVEFEYDAGDDVDAPMIRQMVVKCAQDWTLGADFFELVIKQGADITPMLDLHTENKIEQAMLDRMEKVIKEASDEALIDKAMDIIAERNAEGWIKF